MEIKNTLTNEQLVELMKEREVALHQETDEAKKIEIAQEIEALLKIYFEKNGAKN
jgi:hypothetical protein